MLDLMGDILQKNTLTLDDGVAEVKVLMYADDLVLHSRSRFHLQQALRTLTQYVTETGLEINVEKTKAMQFREGGRIPESEKLRLSGCEIEYVSSFTYLEVILSSTGLCFTRHVEERVRKGILALTSIPNIQKLSMKTALALFEMKVAPCLSYGIPLVWEKLTTGNLIELERVKAAFIKRACGLHASTKNSLFYPLARTTFYVEDLRDRFKLACTPPFVQYQEIKRATREEIDA